MPTNMPKVSVIIPVYNAEAYLRECLDSLSAQTFRGEWEAICVDDGSTDSCPDILFDYATSNSHIRVVHQKNLGTHVARKTGVMAAKGEWCLFLDPDDWLEPNALERFWVAAEHTHSDILGFGAFLHAQEDRMLSVVESLERKFNPIPRTYERDAFFEAVFILHTLPGHLICKAVRTEVCRRAFGDMRDRRISFQEDLCALYRIVAESSSAEILADRLYHYRVGMGISYRPYMSPNEYFGSFSKFDEFQDMVAFRKARYPDGSTAAQALERLEVRLALASISEATERLESIEDGREGVRRLRKVCSDEVVAAACAEWFRLKGDRLANIARIYGIEDILGDISIRQIDFVWRGHNSRLREHDRAISSAHDKIESLKEEIARLHTICTRLEDRFRHPLKSLLKKLWK